MISLRIDSITADGMSYTIDGASESLSFPSADYAQQTATVLIEGTKGRLVDLAIALQGVGINVSGKSLVYDVTDPNGNILRLV